MTYSRFFLFQFYKDIFKEYFKITFFYDVETVGPAVLVPEVTVYYSVNLSWVRLGPLSVCLCVCTCVCSYACAVLKRKSFDTDQVTEMAALFLDYFQNPVFLFSFFLHICSAVMAQL